MSRFLEALRSGRVLLMDGAMGTELQKAGLRAGENGTAWNRLFPERVRAVHQAYIDAGAGVLLTNTFQGNPQALAPQGVEHAQWQSYNQAALEIARAASSPEGFVLGDIGPWEETPLSDKTAVVRTVCLADAILLETFSDLAALGYAYWVRRGMDRQLTVLLSLTYHRDASGNLVTRSGHAPEDFASYALAGHVDALGVNCGRDIGLDDLIEIVRRYRAVTDLPLFARPNAGTPTRHGDRWVYPLTPRAMAVRLPELLEAGVSMVGGCCGTTPAHIAACRPVIDAWNARRDR